MLLTTILNNVIFNTFVLPSSSKTASKIPRLIMVSMSLSAKILWGIFDFEGVSFLLFYYILYRL